jgi:hypothetical protein
MPPTAKNTNQARPNIPPTRGKRRRAADVGAGRSLDILRRLLVDPECLATHGYDRWTRLTDVITPVSA